MAQKEMTGLREGANGWNGASLGQKFGFLSGLLVMLILGSMVIVWSWSPAYKILFSSLNDKNAITVLNALYSNGFDAKLDEATGAILVPASDIHFARIRLSNLGLPELDNMYSQSRKEMNEGNLSSVNRSAVQGNVLYTQRVEEILSRRIEHLLEPLVGVGSVRAQVTINSAVDLTVNGKKNNDETISPQKELENNTNVLNKSNENYPALIGDNKYLSITILVDDKRIVGEGGELIHMPRTTDELEKLTDLVKRVISFNSRRGDSINILNSEFTKTAVSSSLTGPGGMKDVKYRESLRRVIGIVLVVIIISLSIWYLFRILFVANISKSDKTDCDIANDSFLLDPAEVAGKDFEDNMHTASMLVKKDPKLVAQIIKNWVNADGG